MQAYLWQEIESLENDYFACDDAAEYLVAPAFDAKPKWIAAPSGSPTIRISYYLYKVIVDKFTESKQLQAQLEERNQWLEDKQRKCDEEKREMTIMLDRSQKEYMLYMNQIEALKTQILEHRQGTEELEEETERRDEELWRISLETENHIKRELGDVRAQMGLLEDKLQETMNNIRGTDGMLQREIQAIRSELTNLDQRLLQIERQT
ncbi:uncharacterized protein PF3D7_1120000-like [Watersipora subatra]|uniref:uncharacterized protein PF3D7_1120000-like n=1 Tax=Watersipora subatra TaxID=2589382 RepID=UPI00355C3A42